MNNIREALIVERMESRLRAVCELVPPIEPNAAHWLVSDASESYCWECARKARADEMGIAEIPAEPNKFRFNFTPEDERADEILSEISDGIDGGFDTHSDHPESCETCGVTLSYILTDYGVDDELDYYAEGPLSAVSGETSYALDRLALNIYAGADRRQILGVAAVVNQAWRIVTASAA